MPAEVDFGIIGDRVGFGQLKVPGQFNVAGFSQCRLEIPYSTDISRGQPGFDSTSCSRMIAEKGTTRAPLMRVSIRYFCLL